MFFDPFDFIVVAYIHMSFLLPLFLTKLLFPSLFQSIITVMITSGPSENVLKQVTLENVQSAQAPTDSSHGTANARAICAMALLTQWCLLH